MNFVTPKNSCTDKVFGGYVEVAGEHYYRIANSHLMPEFFMMPVSAGDHWMFISSNGALTAGRINPENPLFPYYSADKISDLADSTGPKTLVRIQTTDEQKIWEPFAKDFVGDSIIRNIYKNELGNRVCFEEINQKQGLVFRYWWNSGNEFGFIRSCELLNAGSESAELEIVDGVENLMPPGLDRHFQMRYSNLGDAYKKSELVDSKLGVFYLSSVPTDRAEPNEGLRATAVWHFGLDDPTILLSSIQLENFKKGLPLHQEEEVRARRGAFLLNKKLSLASDDVATWSIVANTALDQTDIVNLDHKISSTVDIKSLIEKDILRNQKDLEKIVAACDGVQIGFDRLLTNRHQSNVLFNTMRGGYPMDGYRIDMKSFKSHIGKINRLVHERNEEFLDGLGDELTLSELINSIRACGDQQLLRIGLEYLPFSFGRRHGDPSRPWNDFSIDLVNEDGSPNRSYQGNWRDIFQNWEALAASFPEYTTGMIFRFVNATTADGYNPYRVTHDGFDWESPDPDDPWSNIGYWGDHQIIYLLKLLEWSRASNPNELNEWLGVECCTFANVPYRIRSYDHIQNDPHNTIDFDYDLEKRLMERAADIGSDGKLLTDAIGNTQQVTLGEKLLLPALIKMTNFVPEGGIWLNTQRPEWNDANNALVGNGLSMVTVYHLRRFFRFVSDWFSTLSLDNPIPVSTEVAKLMTQVLKILQEHAFSLGEPIKDVHRRKIVDSLSIAGSEYRKRLYESGLSGSKEQLPLTAFVEFFEQCLNFLDHAIKANRREDGLYHSYNLMRLESNEASIDHLQEMLEGQVAVLSSAALTPSAALEVLDALQKSAMYREDQSSYMLYPNRNLAKFVEKNCINSKWVKRSKLLEHLVDSNNVALVKSDIQGQLHFSGDLRNAGLLNARLDELEADSDLQALVKEDRELINTIYEETFEHRKFTGRSGTFFGYEGLGSIYWHMVSKLSLAALENLNWATNDPSVELDTLNRLKEHCSKIRFGIGTHKTPQVYGAFPVDPYSHTPQHAGAQQPGMTGQVKEDVLARFFELGLLVDGGTVQFKPEFFNDVELLKSDADADFVQVDGKQAKLHLPKNSFCFTLCQVPIVYRKSGESKVVIHLNNGEKVTREELALTAEETSKIFSRSGDTKKIEVFF